MKHCFIFVLSGIDRTFACITMAQVTCKPHYQTVNGITFPSMCSAKCFREAMDYKAKPNDVFIVTYPKCGTTWMQSIVTHIFRKGRELENPREWCKVSPYIDMIGNQGINLMSRPGAFKSHLSYYMIPYSPKAKYINVYRNPKDCCVSFYYHTKHNVGYCFSEGTFDDFFELFMAGEVMYNDYFDHLMSWYPHRKDNNVFFTTYEDMKKDTKDVVLKVAKFLGKEYIDAIERDNNVLNNILYFSSFQYLKRNISDLYDYFTALKDEDPNMLEGKRHIREYIHSLKPCPEKFQFIRKGIVGDWKFHFSTQQSERMDRKFLERTRGTEIQEKFKNYM